MTATEIRERVSAKEAARMYGIRVMEYDKALCPFHNDSRPSMSFKGQRFKCFVCGAGGDAIDLVQRLYGLDMVEAIARINVDFSLGIDTKRRPSPATMQKYKARQTAAKNLENWKKKALDLCIWYWHQVPRTSTDGLYVEHIIDELIGWDEPAEIRLAYWGVVKKIERARNESKTCAILQADADSGGIPGRIQRYQDGELNAGQAHYGVD